MASVGDFAEGFAALEPLPGGWSGRTFLAYAAGDRSVVRIYPPDPDGHQRPPEVDAAVLALVRGLVPVPDVLEVRPVDLAAGGPGLLVTSYLPGERADLLLPTLDRAARRRLGTQLGDLLADLAGMPLLRPGRFADAELTLAPLPGGDGLPGWVTEHSDAIAHWSAAERAGLAAVAARAQSLLDTITRTCLVHSDLNPKNLLVDPDGLTVTGLVDWEFAHAGGPFTDLGNLLRFERDEAFTRGVLAAYVTRRGGDAAETLELARAADLWALVELSSRSPQNPIARTAHDLLRGIARARDLQATALG